MNKAGIRFNKESYIEITIDGDTITLATIDNTGKIQEYEVTPKNKKTKSSK